MRASATETEQQRAKTILVLDDKPRRRDKPAMTRTLAFKLVLAFLLVSIAGAAPPLSGD